MICPDCNHNLSPLSLPLDEKRNLDVDRCFYCGGLWFDHFEINQLPYLEAVKLATLTPEGKPNNEGLGLCPRCRIPLEPLKAESIPQDTTVLYCTQCHGNFMPQTELAKLKVAQKRKLEYFQTWKIPLQSIYAVLIPVFLFVLSAGVFFTTSQVRQSQENRTRASNLINQPVVVSQEKGSVIVSFFTSAPLISNIKYGQTMEAKRIFTISETPKTFHQKVLENLESEKTYFYQVEVADEKGVKTTSPTYSFVAP